MQQTRVLRNGVKISTLGLGTYQSKDPRVLLTTIDAALENGYRMIDTAAVYRNEHFISEILSQVCPKHNLKPEDVFLTSKLAPADQGYKKALAAFDLSLQQLKRSHLDLYLIHWPGVQGLQRDDPQNARIRKESWKALEELNRNGRAKSIGVSNYTVRHLKEMEEYANIMPHVLQSECHPALPQEDVRAYCKEKGIFFQAYSSLGRGELLKNGTVVKMAVDYKRTPAQVLLKWAVQQGIGVIPKASTIERVQENSKLFDFELSSDDVDKLSSLFTTPYHYCWDPNDVV